MTKSSSGSIDDLVGRRVAEALQAEAERIAVDDRWADIAMRLSSPMPPSQSLERRGRLRRRRTIAIAVAICGLAVALTIAATTLAGWRLFGGSEPAGKFVPTTVARYYPGIPDLVVYRSNISDRDSGKSSISDRDSGAEKSAEDPARYYISPELMRTDDPDIGVAALEALFDTFPVHGDRSGPIGNGDGQNKLDDSLIHDWSHWQDVDVTSVEHSGGLIRVELRGFHSHLAGGPKAAHVMVQAWVYTLQDTYRTRDDVLVTIQGRPFLLYGEVDTRLPIKRDDSIRVKRITGFDTPTDNDVVGSPLVILGYVDAAPQRPARLRVVSLGTGDVAVDEQFTRSTTELGEVRYLDTDRYQCLLEGIDAAGDPYRHEIVITVVP